MSRAGCPWENGRCEGFIKTLKQEEIDARPYHTMEELAAHLGGVLNLRWWKTTSGCFSFLTILSSRHAIESNGTLDAQESAQPGRQDSGLCPGVA
jgi:transposase InsO family protein